MTEGATSDARIEGFMYGVIVSGYTWLAFNGGAHAVEEWLLQCGLSRGATLILELYIVLGTGALLVRRGLSGIPLRDTIGPKPRDFLEKLAAVGASILLWFFVLNVFGIGWLNIAGVIIVIAASAFLINRFARN